MKPAGIVFLVRIAAQGFHCCPGVPIQRFGQLGAYFGVARTGEGDELHAKDEASFEIIGAPAGQIGHRSGSVVGGQGKQEFSAGVEGGEPRRGWMRGAGADDNNVRRFKRAAGAVAMEDTHLGPWSERDARPFRNCIVDLDCGDSPFRADNLSQDRRVIAGAATKMEQMIAGADAKLIEKKSPHAGLAVVDAFGLVEGDEHVVIKMARVVALSRPVFIPAQNPPGSRANETLSWHLCKGGKKLW